MADSDPWLELARRARPALPTPKQPCPNASALGLTWPPPLLIPAWWPRLALLAAAVLVIAWCGIDPSAASPFHLDTLDIPCLP
jgi:hypothetical protein